jgi:hypothetical protein
MQIFNGMKRFLLPVLMLTLCHGALAAERAEADSTRRWAISTNICDWAMLCTLNADVSLATDAHTTIMAGLKYNPFTFYPGEEKQICLRHLVPYIGGRYWFGNIHSGCFAGAKLLAGVYNVSNVLCKGFCEGDLVAAGLNAGWSRHISDRWNLTFGLGFLAAAHRTTVYAGPVCGRILDKKRGFIILPDINLSIDLLL